MATITDYYTQAQMAVAAYALDLDPNMSGTNQGDIYRARLVIAGMTEAQAANFANTYTVVHQYTDPVSGFSGTVFSKGGEYYFALRGTEGFDPTDWATNFGDIGADGMPSLRGLPCSTGCSA